MSILAARTSVPFGATPAVPALTYTTQNQFTISNYDPTLTYLVSGGTRSVNIITVSSVGSTATVTARYGRGLVASSAKSMLTAAYSRVLTSVASTPSDTGCGPRNNITCTGGTILDTNGTVSGGAPGSLIQDPAQGASFCGGACDTNCWSLSVVCWNWRWNNYSTGPDGTGYTLLGNTWGKVQ